MPPIHVAPAGSLCARKGDMFGCRTTATVGGNPQDIPPQVTRQIDPEYFGDIATDWPPLDVMGNDLGSVRGIASGTRTLAVAMHSAGVLSGRDANSK